METYVVCYTFKNGEICYDSFDSIDELCEFIDEMKEEEEICDLFLTKEIDNDVLRQYGLVFNKVGLWRLERKENRNDQCEP